MSTYIVIKKSETTTAHISLCDDGIVRVILKGNSEIDSNDVKQNYETFSELVEGQHYPFLYTTENNSVVYTGDGLKYAKEHSNTAFPKLCNAVVVKSLAHKLIANFYCNFLNRVIPHKTFTDYDEAEAWCLQMQTIHQTKKTNSDFILV